MILDLYKAHIDLNITLSLIEVWHWRPKSCLITKIPMITQERLQNEKTSYRMTSSLLPFTPARPNLIVTSLKSDKVVFLGPPLRPPERVTIPVTLGGISGTSRTIIKSICSPTANWRQARYQSKLKLQVGLIFISSLGKKSAYVSVFERMTYTIYPPPPTTLSLFQK